jgi:hypothetical protein
MVSDSFQWTEPGSLRVGHSRVAGTDHHDHQRRLEPFQGKYPYLTTAILTRYDDCKNTGRDQPQKCSHIRRGSLPGRKNLT